MQLIDSQTYEAQQCKTQQQPTEGIALNKTWKLENDLTKIARTCENRLKHILYLLGTATAHTYTATNFETPFTNEMVQHGRTKTSFLVLLVTSSDHNVPRDRHPVAPSHKQWLVEWQPCHSWTKASGPYNFLAVPC